LTGKNGFLTESPENISEKQSGNPKYLEEDDRFELFHSFENSVAREIITSAKGQLPHVQ
jgi:hypothetical protein